MGTILSKLGFLEEVIAQPSAEISEVIAPFEPEVEPLRTIPGVDPRSAERIVAEIGTDMTRFGSSARLASWAGMCPGGDGSAGKHRSGRTRKGSKWLRTTLTESARAAARSKGTYLAAQHARLKGRRGSREATVAPPRLPISALRQEGPWRDRPGVDGVVQLHLLTGAVLDVKSGFSM